MKIILYIFIAHATFMTHTSLCMLTVFNQSICRSSKPLLYNQQRTFCSVPTLSQERYIALCNQNRKNKEKLRKLEQNPNANLRDIWRLKDAITKNHRILATSQLSSFEESAQ